MGTSHCRRLQLEISKQKIGRRKSTKNRSNVSNYDMIYYIIWCGSDFWKKWPESERERTEWKTDCEKELGAVCDKIVCKRVVSDNVVCERAVCESLERVVCCVWKCCVWLCVWQILWQCCVWNFWTGKMYI
jgi:hypothetical protein